MCSGHGITWRLSKVALVAVALLLCAATALAQGKGNGVEVRAVSPSLQDTEPGPIVSLSFLVTNTTDREEEFIEAVKLPSGWQSIIPTSSFTLRPAEATTRIIALRVPISALAQRYDVTYSVRSQRDHAIQDADTVAIVVLPVGQLALLLVHKPDTVIAGDEYQVKLRVINEGNATLEVKLEVTSRENYPAIIEPAETTLAAGGSEVVTVTVQTDPNEDRLRKHTIQVKAEAQELADGRPSAGLAVSVDIIPTVTREPDMYHRLPATLTINVHGRDGAHGVQAELRGAGTLDEEGTKAIKFLLRPFDTQGKGIFGKRDEYWLNYATADYDVRLGDQSFALSRLTSYFAYGRGLGVSFHPPDDSVKLGTCYLRSRWSRPGRKQFGAYVGHRINDRLRTKFNLLRKEYDSYGDTPAVHDSVWSVEGEFQPSDKMKLEVEYGRSDSNRSGGVRDDAFRVGLNGQAGQKTYYSFSKTHAGPDYYGYYHDADYTRGSVSFPLGGRLQGHVSYSRWESNVDLRDNQTTAPKENLLQLGLRYSLPSKWYLSLDYDDFRRRDRLAPADYDYEEDALRLSVGRSTGRSSVRVELRGGEQSNLIEDRSKRVHRFNLFTTYRPSRDFLVTLYGGFGKDDALRGSRLLGGSNNLGASTTWKPSDDLEMSLWYVKYNYNAHDRPETDQFSFRTRYALRNGHSLDFQIRHYRHELSRNNDTTYAFTYTIPIPLSLPVRKKKNVGVIRGRVFDADAAEGVGIVRAILTTTGATAVTDAKGHFVFPCLTAGAYSVYVDRKSIGLNRVTEHKLPILVEIIGGQITELDIGVIEAAHVSGTVMVVPANSNGNGNGCTVHDGQAAYVVGDPRSSNGNGNGNGENSREPWGLGNVLVELANGEEVLRTSTDYEGQFLFENLRPGEWRLKIYDHNLPAYHYLEKSEMDLELRPAEAKEVCLKVLPRLRRIRMIEDSQEVAL